MSGNTPNANTAEQAAQQAKAGANVAPAVMVVMGVSGCGKSTIAAALAAALDAPYLDADDYHPPANVAKMSRGEPLEDADRWPWLQRFGRALNAHSTHSSNTHSSNTHASNTRCVGACSALKRSYREALNAAVLRPVLYIHLTGSRQLLSERIGARSGHFMPSTLLDSQLGTLEAPAADEFALTLAISGSPRQIVAAILAQLA